jgi:DNA repair ATPase RecN
MNSDVTISLSLLFSIVSVVGVIVAIVTSLKKNQEEEATKYLDIEKHFVKIDMKLDNFMDSTRQILKNQEKANDQIQELSEKLIAHDKELENHNQRLKKLEGME